MPYSLDHKKNTRQRILESAHRLFSASGFEATSIEDIMLECDLTRGAFYAHFRSKGDLYQEAMHCDAPWHGTSDPAAKAISTQWIDALLESCMHPADATERTRSVWMFLATDVTCKQPEVRAAYTAAIKRLAQRLDEEMNRFSGNDRASLAAMAMVVGTLAVAMTVDDCALKTSLVLACREHARTLLEDGKDDRPNFFWTADVSTNAHALLATRLVH